MTIIEPNKKIFKFKLTSDFSQVKDAPEDLYKLNNSFFESEDGSVAFLFDSGNNLMKILTNYAEKNKIEYLIEDVTEISLLGLNEDPIFNEVFVNSITEFGKPLERLVDWRIENLSKDDVLDKIYKYGIEKLDLVDKFILDSND